jgi:hypothetical protein
MEQQEMIRLLERYHDQAVTQEEAAQVEELLTSNTFALDYLGTLDAQGEALRLGSDEEVNAVSFDGMWARIATDIQAIDAEKAAARAPVAEPAQSNGMMHWLRALFSEHKSAWITAGATAAAVAVVLLVLDRPNNELDSAPRVVEKHFIHVDSVNKADPAATVVVNSMQDDDTAVIWLLPNGGENGDAPESDDADQDEDVEITEEPL